MDAERWARIKSVFYTAAERPADERPAFIKSQCDGDESLASEVESLLAAHDGAGSFIEALPTGEATVALEDLPLAVGRHLLGDLGVAAQHLRADR